MVTIGVDAHKRVHMAVAMNDRGQETGRWRGANTPASWTMLVAWAATQDGQRIWGIEGSGQYGQGLAQRLVATGDTVYEVNPRLTAGMRRSGRERGKSDALDALAVARVVQREDRLPQVHPETMSTVLAELTADRDAAMADATRLRNQLHVVLSSLGTIDDGPWPSLSTRGAVASLQTYRAPVDDPVSTTRAQRVRHLADRLVLAMTQVDALGRQIATLGAPLTPLLAIPGIGALTAGMLAGILGSRHFATDAQLASYAGVAPLEVASAHHARHRLNRTGNRHLNAIIHRIVLTQSRGHPPARAYLARRQQEGRTRADAVRCLKRYVARAIFHAWTHCSLPPLSMNTRAPLT